MSVKKHQGWEGGAERRYLCPQCFSTHYYNDVLFTEDGWVTPHCDIRQAVHRSTFDPEGFADWCAAGRSPVVRTWRGCAPQDLRTLGDTVLGMRDPGGTWLSRRVCPVCHSVLPQAFPILFGWDAGGMNNGIVQKLFALAAGAEGGVWHAAQQENPGVLAYEFVQRNQDIAYLSVPLGLENAHTHYGQSCINNCCLNAQGVVVELPLDAGTDGRVDESRAEKAVASLLERCQYGSTALKKAVVCIVTGPEGEKDPVGRLEQEDKQLLLRMRYSFTDVQIVGAPLDAKQGTDILDWLLQHCES